MLTDTLIPREGLYFNLRADKYINSMYIRDFDEKIEISFVADNAQDLILSVLLSEHQTICRWKTTLIDWITIYKDQIFLGGCVENEQ